MALTTDEHRFQGIGQLLVLENLLTKTKAVEFYKLAAEEKTSLLQYLVKNNILSAEQIASTAAQSFGVPLIDIDCIDIENTPLNLVNEKLIRRHAMIPLFSRGTNLYLATDDPSKQASLNEIQFHTGLNTYAIVVETDKLSLFIDHLLSAKENQGLMDYGDDHDLEGLEISSDDEEPDVESPASVTEDAPIVKFVNKILLEAIKEGASDIHFEPYDREYRIRYRQDGILHEVATPPANLSSRITARIKVMSNLDISERRIPQDGGFKGSCGRTDKKWDFKIRPNNPCNFIANS
nr:ATPase, T2SS/T4P/T4SS family [Legionella antarctica]